ncbi:MAG: ParB/RepB/Spo0J family partition protein [Bacteroidales bacterium]|nr:ParB/RepB/Spo0J family partition protein [Bacteroidales bacterium]
MAKQKPGGLGRGLGSILPDIDTGLNGAEADAVCMLPLGSIAPNPFQPRREFDEAALDELAQSIRAQGVITPVTVRRMPDGTYQLVSGERRLRAAGRAGLGEIPAYVRTATDAQMMEMALVENIQRADLGAIEVAEAYRLLLEECRLTHEQLSERVGKDRSTITNYLRLLTLPEATQQALQRGDISMAHARALAGIDDERLHLDTLRQVLERHLSVHDTELMVKEAKLPPKAARANRRAELPQGHTEARTWLKERLQSAVDIKRSQRGKGTVTIAFNNDADFNRIMALLGK